MIDPAVMFALLRERGVRLFTGVPDSLLKPFCACIAERAEGKEHIITANEGNAVALAAGHHLATGAVPLVYMQNSGLGNAINPLTSLVDPEVYRIPLILLIGWRGEPGHQDEPQHLKQGRITAPQLELLEIPTWVVEAATNPTILLDEVFRVLAEHRAPVALLVREGAFSNFRKAPEPEPQPILLREAAVRRLLELASEDDLIISTTGKTSRELYELRIARGETPRDFLTVGSMGHTSSIALGVALGCPNRRVICLDGDGSLLMHLGALAIAGNLKPVNLVHVLLNNAAHESVGGQPTVADRMDFRAVASGCGYRGYQRATNLEELDQAWGALSISAGPCLLEVRIEQGSRKDLGRPASTPEENKRAFIRTIRG
jgi:phosphonopyruvate decarboxylase